MKKMMIATLAAAGVLLTVANQVHAGATLDAIKRKASYNVGSVMGCPAFLTPTRRGNSRALMSTYAAVSLLLCSATTAK